MLKKQVPLDASTNIVRDLQLDSLAVMDFIMSLEDRFEIVIPLDRVAEVETLGDLSRLSLMNCAEGIELVSILSKFAPLRQTYDSLRSVGHNPFEMVFEDMLSLDRGSCTRVARRFCWGPTTTLA